MHNYIIKAPFGTVDFTSEAVFQLVEAAFSLLLHANVASLGFLGSLDIYGKMMGRRLLMSDSRQCSLDI